MNETLRNWIDSTLAEEDAARDAEAKAEAEAEQARVERKRQGILDLLQEWGVPDPAAIGMFTATGNLRLGDTDRYQVELLYCNGYEDSANDDGPGLYVYGTGRHIHTAVELAALLREYLITGKLVQVRPQVILGPSTPFYDDPKDDPFADELPERCPLDIEA